MMQIYFARSGGFMGLKLTTALDIKSLPQDEAEAWRRVLTEDQFRQLPSALEDQRGPDGFSYELTVVDENWQHTAVFTDDQVTEEMQPVIRRLIHLARSDPKQGNSIPD